MIGIIIGINMLNQATIADLKDSFSSMTKSELEKALEILLDEAFKREWPEDPEEYLWTCERKEEV